MEDWEDQKGLTQGTIIEIRCQTVDVGETALLTPRSYPAWFKND